MAGRHRGGDDAALLAAQIQQMVSDTNAVRNDLSLAKSDIRTVGSKLLALYSQNQDVMIAGGEFLNVVPQLLDEITNRLDRHAQNIEHYAATIR